MPSNRHWPRWVFASVCKHFNDRKEALPLYIEGQHRDANPPKDFLELRMDGPYLTEESKDYWRLYIEISILVQSTVDDQDYHRIHKSVGQVAEAFTEGISVFKYGDGDDDDQSLIGCLQLVQDLGKRERIQINHFGQVEAATPLRMASVEGHYVMYLDE